MAFQQWIFPKEDRALSAILAQECGISPLAASVLIRRGNTTYENAMRFLETDGRMASPFDLKDMEPAVSRIRDAIENDEKITVYGDYDCDGITATVILYTYLSSVGANVAYYIPERGGDGYGLNNAALQKIAQEGSRLVITVDNGISAVKEAEYAQTLPLDLIITDHHQPGEFLPAACAVVNPHRKDDLSGFKHLAGVGVVIKLLAALEDGDYQTILEDFSELAALGTVSDIVPLMGENRFLVQCGLRAATYSSNVGFLALLEVSGVDPQSLNAQTIAFSLAPRINAAGRMEQAALSAELLLSEDYEEALSLAQKLNELNQQRREREEDILSDIERLMTENNRSLSERVLVLQGDDWPHGILGILCSRLLERYGKPVLLMTLENGLLKGSARSLGDFHLFKALSYCGELLTKFGGHKLAAGFTLEVRNLEAFGQKLQDYAGKYHDSMPAYRVEIDALLKPSDLTLECIGAFSGLEPFGYRNEPPLFCIENAKLLSITPLSEDRHLRLSLLLDGVSFEALYFGMDSRRFPYSAGDMLDLVVNADIHAYNGKQSVSLKIRDMRPSGFSQDKFFAAKDCYDKIVRGEPVGRTKARLALPVREEIGAVYKFLRSCGGLSDDFENLYLRFVRSGLNYCKLRIILDVLEELNLIRFLGAAKGIEVNTVEGKADLQSARLLRRLQEEAQIVS